MIGRNRPCDDGTIGCPANQDKGEVPNAETDSVKIEKTIQNFRTASETERGKNGIPIFRRAEFLAGLDRIAVRRAQCSFGFK